MRYHDVLNCTSLTGNQPSHPRSQAGQLDPVQFCRKPLPPPPKEPHIRTTSTTATIAVTSMTKTRITNMQRHQQHQQQQEQQTPNSNTYNTLQLQRRQQQRQDATGTSTAATHTHRCCTWHSCKRLSSLNTERHGQDQGIAREYRWSWLMMFIGFTVDDPWWCPSGVTTG